ncbi:hypothetical protein [Alistipes sp. ZOR0009]|uniref:hypothetical protein n=1 Tax=Alistipes sp. ZOR0009 TaxID=1339253 RepID=UPI000646EDEC|nr:hypothetical protein [Alistipes sp. ZOR0009]
MSTKKYVVLIILGLVMLAGLGGAFIHFYSKKNQTTDALAAIPTDAVALVRVNHPAQLLSADTASNLFYRLENPQVKQLFERLSRDNDFGEMLTSTLLISFHPVGKDRLEPLIILRSNEEFSQRTIAAWLQKSRLKIGEIDYNGKPLYSCTFPDGSPLYLSHEKGITTISPSLIVIESSIRKLDASYPAEEELKKAYNLTSSSSSASIAISMKQAAPWLKANFFSEEACWATAASDLCSWLVLDYQQGNDELAFSGMLTTNDNTSYGKSMATMSEKDLLTPTLITENTAFCVERVYEQFASSIAPASETDKKKLTIRQVLTDINPNRAILQHIKNPRNDSTGFVLMLYPQNADSTIHKLRSVTHLKNIEANSIVKLKLDSTSSNLSSILGKAFGIVTPTYALFERDRVTLAASERMLKLFQYEQTIASMRKNKQVIEVWSNKITPSGVAALYINPNFSEKMVSLLFGNAVKKLAKEKAFAGWNGLGMMLTPSGSNLLVSGYMSRRVVTETPQFTRTLPKSSVKHTLLTLSNGSNFLMLSYKDSLVAYDGKLNKRWGKKLKNTTDSIFTYSISGEPVVGILSKNNILFYNSKGTLVNDYNFDSKPEIVGQKALKSASDELLVVDKSNNVYMLALGSNDKPKKLFRLKFRPSNLALASMRKQNYIVTGRNNRTEILNSKGSLVRRVSFDIRNGKVLVIDKKMLLFKPEQGLMVNSQFMPMADKMTAHFTNIQKIKDGLNDNSQGLLLLGDKFVQLVSKDLTEKFEAKTTSEPVYVQIVRGASKGIIVIDADKNIYHFDSKGELYNGYPYNIKDATYVVTNPDGTLFAISFKANTLSSKEISNELPTLL